MSSIRKVLPFKEQSYKVFSVDDMRNIDPEAEAYSSSVFIPFDGAEVVEPDTLGYRSVKAQIDSFVIAGANLNAWRSGVFDSDFFGKTDEEILKQAPNPFTDPGFDFADAFAYSQAMTERIQQRAELLKQQQLAASSVPPAGTAAAVPAAVPSPSASPVSDSSPKTD